MEFDYKGGCNTDLKEKSQQELIKEIRSLKREINQLKKYLEEHFGEKREAYLPEITRLKYCRECLDLTIRAYLEAGGEYMPAKAEQRRREFDESLQFVRKFIFSIGGYTGFETRTYTVSGEDVNLTVENTLKPDTGNIPSCNVFSKKDFVNGLREIHIGEWKKNYVDPDIFDLTQWELRIEFDGGRKPVEIHGSNGYPYNFSELTDFLGINKGDELETTVEAGLEYGRNMDFLKENKNV